MDRRNNSPPPAAAASPMDLNKEPEECPSGVGVNVEPELEETKGDILNLASHVTEIEEPIQDVAGHLIPNVVKRQYRKRTTCEVRRRVYQELLKTRRNGKAQRGAKKTVAEKFGLHIRTVQRIWKQEHK